MYRIVHCPGMKGILIVADGDHGKPSKEKTMWDSIKRGFLAELGRPIRVWDVIFIALAVMVILHFMGG